MRFFVADASGFIVRGGDCPESQIEYQQLAPGETLHLGDASTWTHKVVDGVPVPYNDAELAAIAARPGRRYVWNVATGQWDDLRSQEEKDAERRATLLAQIRALELTQLRSTRELVLARGSQLEARARLEQIDDQIAALRAQLP